MSIRVLEIASVADKLVLDCGTRNPIRLARELDIEVIERDFKRQCGAYNVVLNNDFIFVKKDLCDELKNIVIMHEIGHFMLHRNEAVKAGGLKDFNVFSKQSIQMEQEANIFAAQVMLPDDKVCELVDLQYDAGQIASHMNTDVNLIAVKICIMQAKGFEFCSLENKADFLKRLV